MATTAEYLAQLQTDKANLVSTLTNKGLSASEEDTITTLATKINTLANPTEFFVEKMNYAMFSLAKTIKSMPNIDSTSCTSFQSAFANAMNLETIPELDATKVSSVYTMFADCRNLTNVGGFKNLGQAYSTSQSENYSSYTLDLSSTTKLTEQSMINILNDLYDIKTKGCNVQRVKFGTTNLAKLTSEEGQAALASATEKGWSVS